MKRSIALFLVLLLALSLAGCAGGGSKDPLNPLTTKEALRTDPKPEETTTEPVQTEPPIVFEALTVIDNEECTVKITGLEHDSFWGYTLKVYLENKSAEKNYMFSVVSAAVNGVVWDPYFAAEVAHGKKLNDTISFSDDEKEALLQEFTDIELEFRVYDSDDWTAEETAHETVHVYPLGPEKAKVFVREPQSTDTVLVDNDRLSVIVTGYDPENFWGYTVKLYLVNKTDTPLMFSAEDASVNGFMCDPFWATTVGAGKVSFSELSWSQSKFEENGITEVQEIEMELRARDADDWMADYLFRETVTLKP